MTMSRRMLSNLDQGLDADGAVILGSDAEERRAVGLRVWRDRERQLLYSLVNCCVLHQVKPCRMRVLFINSSPIILSHETEDTFTARISRPR